MLSDTSEDKLESITDIVSISLISAHRDERAIESILKWPSQIMFSSKDSSATDEDSKSASPLSEAHVVGVGASRNLEMHFEAELLEIVTSEGAE
jgi:hypothetical protein